jgi:hypothetical protein
MHYMLILNETPADFERRDHPENAPAYWAAWMAYSKAVKDAGIFIGGSGLEGPHATTSVSVKNGQTQIHDGPYPETKEMLGGYMIIEVPDLDTAIRWAARSPSATQAPVLVRPLLQQCGGGENEGLKSVAALAAV